MINIHGKNANLNIMMPILDYCFCLTKKHLDFYWWNKISLFCIWEYSN